jgi:hypothetical protein
VINFYRDTDPVGHRLRPEQVPELLDVYLADPANERYFPGDPQPEVRGHAERGYRRQRVFRTVLGREVDRLAVRVRPTAASDPLTSPPATSPVSSPAATGPAATSPPATEPADPNATAPAVTAPGTALPTDPVSAPVSAPGMGTSG